MSCREICSRRGYRQRRRPRDETDENYYVNTDVNDFAREAEALHMPRSQIGKGAQGTQSGYAPTSQMYPSAYPSTYPPQYSSHGRMQRLTVFPPVPCRDPMMMDVGGSAFQRPLAGMDRAKVKTVTSNANILSQKNPDIFETSPRPGGFLKISKTPSKALPSELEECQQCNEAYEREFRNLSSKISEQRSARKTSEMRPFCPETTTREFRIKRALFESDWETTVVDETDTVVGICNPYAYGMNMLAVTITTVMMMASKMDVTQEYLDWTQSYLQCIKDDNNQVPRNVAGLLKEIERRKGQSQEKEAEDAEAAASTPPESGKDSPGKKDSTPAVAKSSKIDNTESSKVKNDKSCAVVCKVVTDKKKSPAKCTTTSSCTTNKNLCGALRFVNPCPNLRMPRCNIKCGHISTIDDFVSPTSSHSSGKKHT